MIAAQAPAPESAFAFAKTQRRRLNLKMNRNFAKFRKNHEAILRKIRVERKTEGAERLRTRGSKEHFQNRMIGVTFKDEKMWKITDVDWDRGLKRYVVSYEPSKVSRSTSQQDRLGYETQLAEVLEMLGEKKRKELGLVENYAYWDGLRKSDLKGSGIAQWRMLHGHYQDEIYYELQYVCGCGDPVLPPIVVMHDRRPTFRSDVPVMLEAGLLPPPPPSPRTPLPTFKQPRRSETNPLTADEKQIRQFRRVYVA